MPGTALEAIKDPAVEEGSNLDTIKADAGRFMASGLKCEDS